MERPTFITDEMLKYLDKLRESNVTNMFGAAAYLREDFHELSKNESYKVLSYWMDTFGESDR